MTQSLGRRMAAFALVFSLLAGAMPASAQRHRHDPPPPHDYWKDRRDPPPGHDFRPRPDPYPRWEDRHLPPPVWAPDAWSVRRSWLLRHGHRVEDDSTAGLIAGVILGFALGAAVVDTMEEQQRAEARLNDPGWIAYCARRYASFDPYTGTYLGADGLRHYCR